MSSKKRSQKLTQKITEEVKKQIKKYMKEESESESESDEIDYDNVAFASINGVGKYPIEHENNVLRFRGNPLIEELRANGLLDLNMMHRLSNSSQIALCIDLNYSLAGFLEKECAKDCVISLFDKDGKKLGEY